jgi:hypothetical protein
VITAIAVSAFTFVLLAAAAIVVGVVACVLLAPILMPTGIVSGVGGVLVGAGTLLVGACSRFYEGRSQREHPESSQHSSCRFGDDRYPQSDRIRHRRRWSRRGALFPEIRYVRGGQSGGRRGCQNGGGRGGQRGSIRGCKSGGGCGALVCSATVVAAGG